jgi:putative ABC transport system permease protein
MHRWLEDYYYRIDLGAGLILATGVLALLIAVLTVGFQSVRAARANPVESLRHE